MNKAKTIGVILVLAIVGSNLASAASLEIKLSSFEGVYSLGSQPDSVMPFNDIGLSSIESLKFSLTGNIEGGGNSLGLSSVGLTTPESALWVFSLLPFTVSAFSPSPFDFELLLVPSYSEAQLSETSSPTTAEVEQFYNSLLSSNGVLSLSFGLNTNTTVSVDSASLEVIGQSTAVPIIPSFWLLLSGLSLFLRNITSQSTTRASKMHAGR